MEFASKPADHVHKKTINRHAATVHTHERTLGQRSIQVQYGGIAVGRARFGSSRPMTHPMPEKGWMVERRHNDHSEGVLERRTGTLQLRLGRGRRTGGPVIALLRRPLGFADNPFPAQRQSRAKTSQSQEGSPKCSVLSERVDKSHCEN
jgi:hypothetical protein